MDEMNCVECNSLKVEITRKGFKPYCKLNKRKFKERLRYDPSDKDMQEIIKCSYFKIYNQQEKEDD